MNCPNCGTVADSSYRFCDTCGASLESRPSTPASGGAATSVVDARVASPGVTGGTLPGTPILLGDGEIIWRQYRAAQLHNRAQGEGMLYVTDSRVVFYARAKGRGTQRPSALVQQTKLEHVTGLAAYVSRRVSLGLFVLTFLLGLAALVALVNQSWLPLIILAALTAGGVTVLARGAAKRGSVGVMIHSSATEASPIGFGQFGEQRSAIGNLIHALLQPLLALFGVFTAFDVLVGFPGQDSEQIIAELGALIFDLQTMGDLAGTHWGVEAGEALRDVSR